MEMRRVVRTGDTRWRGRQRARATERRQATTVPNGAFAAYLANRRRLDHGYLSLPALFVPAGGSVRSRVARGALARDMMLRVKPLGGHGAEGERQDECRDEAMHWKESTTCALQGLFRISSRRSPIGHRRFFDPSRKRRLTAPGRSWSIVNVRPFTG